MSLVGSRVRRVEDARLLTVGGTYLADRRDPILEGALHVAFVRATVAHATIASIDVAGALALPGVVAVVTGADVDLPPLTPPVPMIDQAMVRPLLAVDRVRFVGEPVAAVLAETPAQAADAVEAVWVDYVELPVVVDPELAADDAVVLHEAAGTNLAVELDGGRDEALFDGCEVVVAEQIRNQRVAAVALEGRAGAAVWTADGRLHHFVSTQNAHGVRDADAGIYGLDLGAVRVVAPDVGGGFGPKIGASPEELLLPWLARRAGRAVRWAETRSENLVGQAQGRAQVQIVELGGRRDGTIDAFRLSVLQDCGAYPAIGAFLPFFTRLMASGPYAIPRIECSTTSVVTNTTPVGAYHGAGRAEATAALERAIDVFAATIGMDPVEVRRINLIEPFDAPIRTAVDTTYDCGDYESALDAALAAAGYDGLRAEQARRRAAGDPIALGIGVACYVDLTAGPSAGDEYAKVLVLDDGSVVVHTGASPHGQGHVTAFSMLASDALGIPLERIAVVHGDTDVVARGVGTFGSRSLQLGGAAVQQSALQVVDLATQVAATLLGTAAASVVLDRARGVFHVAGAPAVFRTWREVATAAGGSIEAAGDFEAAQPTFPFGTHVAVVEVDTETGEVHLRRLVACDDAGTIVDPLLGDGQRHGSIARGVGQALHEEVRHDGAGHPRTATLGAYGAPTASQLPSFELVAHETPTWVNPLGAKGIGECGHLGATPAVQSAVCDALAHLGVTHVDLPCTPARVWAAIERATGGGSSAT